MRQELPLGDRQIADVRMRLLDDDVTHDRRARTMQDQSSTQARLAEDRTVLAAERTFASWLRTGLAFLSVGLGLQRFLHKRGTKRSVLTDGRGVPMGVAIAGADRNDHLLMGDTLDALGVERPRPTVRRKQHLCLDKGYDYAEPRRLAADLGFILHLRTRGEEVQAKRHRNGKTRRWVVEAAHAWTNRFRDLLIRWCKKPDNSLALTHFAFGIIAWRHCLTG